MEFCALRRLLLVARSVGFGASLQTHNVGERRTIAIFSYGDFGAEISGSTTRSVASFTAGWQELEGEQAYADQEREVRRSKIERRAISSARPICPSGFEFEPADLTSFFTKANECWGMGHHHHRELLFARRGSGTFGTVQVDSELVHGLEECVPARRST